MKQPGVVEGKVIGEEEGEAGCGDWLTCIIVLYEKYNSIMGGMQFGVGIPWP